MGEALLTWAVVTAIERLRHEESVTDRALDLPIRGSHGMHGMGGMSHGMGGMGHGGGRGR